MRRLIYIFIIGLLLCSYTWADGSRYASKSLLSEGKWVKIRVDKTGIYKLSYADLKNMGFSDPSKVSVHGYGGWPLDEDFSKEYIDDVPTGKGRLNGNMTRRARHSCIRIILIVCMVIIL